MLKVKSTIAEISLLSSTPLPQKQIQQPNQLISSPFLLQKQSNDVILSPSSDTFPSRVEMSRESTESDFILPLCNYPESNEDTYIIIFADYTYQYI